MAGNLSSVRITCAWALVAVSCAWSCERPRAMSVGWGGRARLYTGTDSMGALPTETASVPIHTRALPENSAAAMSRTQPGVLFTINDSGNEPVLYAIDTSGALRGAWRIRGATNVDWEAAAIGPCAPGGTDPCVYIGDTGDNDDALAQRTIYRLPEPRVTASGGGTRSLDAERLDYSYADGPRDVEAMYVAPNGDTFLITKRPSTGTAARLRPALVYRLGASAWGSGPVRAEQVDSIEVVPGSAPLRVITDASLSPDGRHLAVRTYMQVYVFAIDSATGRVDHRIAPSVCNVVSLGESQGEGITWADDNGRFVLTSEGRDSPLELANCPLPH